MAKYRIKPGWGYYKTDNYPIGGSFKRCPKGSDGLVVTVTREFKDAHGCNVEGVADDGTHAAFNKYNAELIEGR